MITVELFNIIKVCMYMYIYVYLQHNISFEPITAFSEFSLSWNVGLLPSTWHLEVNLA